MNKHIKIGSYLKPKKADDVEIVMLWVILAIGFLVLIHVLKMFGLEYQQVEG